MTSANDATRTYDCKTPACPNTASSPRGRHSYCPTCQTKKGQRRQDGSTIHYVGSPNTRPAKAAVAGGHEERARKIMSAARALDKAEHRARVALKDVASARATHRDALLEAIKPYRAGAST